MLCSETKGETKWTQSGKPVLQPVDIPSDINKDTDPLCGIIYTGGYRLCPNCLALVCVELMSNYLFAAGVNNMTLTDNCANRHPFICEAAAVDSIIQFSYPSGEHNSR